MQAEEQQRIDRRYRRLAGRLAWNVVSFAGLQGRESAIRRRSAERLELRPGDAVLDVACGRGSNFPYLEAAVGRKGRIVGLDHSTAMLSAARELAERRGWANVTLVEADAAEMTYAGEFDAALCALSLYVIPGWREALRRTAAAVQPGGRVVVMDGRIGKGVRRLGNPYARLFARVVAADVDRDVEGEFRRLFPEAGEDTALFGAYVILSGRVAAESEGIR